MSKSQSQVKRDLPPPKKKRFNPEEEEDHFEEDDDDEEDEEEVPEDFEGDMEEKDDVEGENTSIVDDLKITNKEWLRPEVKLDQDTPLIFQQMYADYYSGKQKSGFKGSMGTVPIVRFYGVTETGNSVLANVYGYYPYIYIKPPYGFNLNNLTQFKEFLTKKMNDSKMSKKDDTEWILNVERVNKSDVFTYQFGKQESYLKITLGMPMFVTRLRKMLEEGMDIPGLGYRKFQTYESNVLFILRCMIDQGMQGASWIELPKYHLRNKRDYTSHCQIEVDVEMDSIIPHEPIGEWSKIAPARILSFDIECAGKDGHFPQAERDPVILISNYVSLQGQDFPFIKNVFVLGSCAPITGVEVHTFTDEKELLKTWRNFIVSLDPDLMTGYNFINFDLPYLINRAKTLGIQQFAQLGRIKGTNAKIANTNFSSKQMGPRETKEVVLDGRVQIDVMQAIVRDYKLSSYSLNAVSAHFLGEQKEKVHHSIIEKLFHGDETDRKRLAVYCLKDAYLPQRLLDKLMIIINYVEMARVTGIPLSFILERGQQIRVVSQLLRKTKQKGYIMPTPQVKENTQWNGGKVFEPKMGYYTDPIATLDFASLYPSIMIAHNLCYTTLVRKNDVSRLKPEDYFQTPYGAYFVKPTVHKGFLPEILVELLQARKVAKKEYAMETDPLKRNVLNGRQLALKISANSVYGFTGAQMGSLPCLDISASVTAIGRDMILRTKEIVEEKFTIKNGYKWNAEVIYGDTDSVMVKFGTSDISEAMKMGKEAAEYVSTHFIAPIQLQFEKVYCPYLLMKKKRYAGLKWTSPDKYEKLDTVGLETVRRDNCELVRHLITQVLNLVLVKKNVQEAIDYTKAVISDLLMNRLDISMLVITKSISKKVDDYKNKQTHTELAAKMMKRDPSTAPHLGDRVPYVMIKSEKGAKAYEKSEDPIYVLENNIPIDTKYYLEHQLAKPLCRVFAPILKEPEKELLSGEHTRNIFVPTPTVGGIMKFAKKRESCLGCRAALKEGEVTLCENCKTKESKIYQNIVVERNHYETVYSRVWTQCQRCQQSLHQDILCSNRDCPVFYMRKKVQKDLKESQDKLDKFEKLPDW